MNKPSLFQYPVDHRFSTRCIAMLFVGLLSGAVLTPAHAQTGTVSAYERNALFNPAESLLRAEARGRVTIYDGLDNRLVERALDTQFDRIDHMMFVRIRHTEPDGTLYEDDSCD